MEQLWELALLNFSCGRISRQIVVNKLYIVYWSLKKKLTPNSIFIHLWNTNLLSTVMFDFCTLITICRYDRCFLLFSSPSFWIFRSYLISIYHCQSPSLNNLTSPTRVLNVWQRKIRELTIEAKTSFKETENLVNFGRIR